MTANGSIRGKLSRLGLLVLAAAALAGCETVSETASGWYGKARGVFVGDAADGGNGGDRPYIARRMRDLGEIDAVLLNDEAARALEDAPAGQTILWSSPDSGARAEITPGAIRLVQREIEGVRVTGLAEAELSEIVGRRYRVRSRVNLRAGPGTEHAILGRLDKGRHVTVIARVAGLKWLMIGRGDRAIGYVYAPLLKPAGPGATAAVLREWQAIDPDELAPDTVIVGALVETPCRALDYSVTDAEGNTRADAFHACKAADGAWEIVPSGVAALQQ